MTIILIIIIKIIIITTVSCPFLTAYLLYNLFEVSRVQASQLFTMRR